MKTYTHKTYTQTHTCMCTYTNIHIHEHTHTYRTILYSGTKNINNAKNTMPQKVSYKLEPTSIPVTAFTGVEKYHKTHGTTKDPEEPKQRCGTWREKAGVFNNG